MSVATESGGGTSKGRNCNATRAKILKKSKVNQKFFDFWQLFYYIALMEEAQTNLLDYFDTRKTRRRYGRTQHGGVESKGHRKIERPLSTSHPIHLVLKSHKAEGELSLLTAKNKPLVESIIRDKAQKFGVRISQYSNVGNALHLKVRISSRTSFNAYLKAITTLIARAVTGARRGQKFGKFWQGQAFTRVLVSRREHDSLHEFFKASQSEAKDAKVATELFLAAFNRYVFRERIRGKKLECKFED